MSTDIDPKRRRRRRATRVRPPQARPPGDAARFVEEVRRVAPALPGLFSVPPPPVVVRPPAPPVGVVRLGLPRQGVYFEAPATDLAVAGVLALAFVAIASAGH